MTENKRFQVHKVIGSFHEWSIEDIIDDKVVFRSIIHKYSADILCAKLNELSEQADAVRTELQLCEEENNALQERNDRQYEILRKLYTLIGNKDWKGLTVHMEELDKCEEQLRKEWRLYSE